MKISLDLAKLQLAENNFVQKQSFSFEWVFKIEKILHECTANTITYFLQ